MSGGTLTIEFLDEARVLEPPTGLTFGRAGDLVIDDANRFLHRILGRFSFHDGLWWLENLGQHVELTVLGGDGTQIRLTPRPPEGDPSATALTVSDFVVSFRAGDLPYELSGSLAAAAGPGMPLPTVTEGVDTSAYGRVELTDDEHRLVVALAAPCLRDPAAGPDTLPANREIASGLGWTITKFNRKLDYLCTRLTKAGVKGLRGGRGAEATNRRWRLVEHVIAARLVTPADLDRQP